MAENRYNIPNGIMWYNIRTYVCMEGTGIIYECWNEYVMRYNIPNRWRAECEILQKYHIQYHLWKTLWKKYFENFEKST